MRISEWRTEMHVTRESFVQPPLIPAKAGIQGNNRRRVWLWIPASAGMSGEGGG
jgi:hypothetical protein